MVIPGLGGVLFNHPGFGDNLKGFTVSIDDGYLGAIQFQSGSCSLPMPKVASICSTVLTLASPFQGGTIGRYLSPGRTGL